MQFVGTTKNKFIQEQLLPLCVLIRLFCCYAYALFDMDNFVIRLTFYWYSILKLVTFTTVKRTIELSYKVYCKSTADYTGLLITVLLKPNTQYCHRFITYYEWNITMMDLLYLINLWYCTNISFWSTRNVDFSSACNSLFDVCVVHYCV